MMSLSSSDNNAGNQVQIEFADGGRMVLPESIRPGDRHFWATVIADAVRAGRPSVPTPADLMDQPSPRSVSASTSLAPTAAAPSLASSPHEGLSEAMPSTVAAVPFAAASLQNDQMDAVPTVVAWKREVPDSDPDYNFEEEDVDDEGQDQDQAEAVSTSRINLEGRPGLTVRLRRPQSTIRNRASSEQQLHTYTSTRQMIVDRHGVKCSPCKENNLECINLPSPRGFRCVACYQYNRACDWGEAWVRNYRIHHYLKCLKRGCSLEDADKEVYAYLGILGGPLDKVKTYSWSVPSAAPSGSGGREAQ